MNSSNRSVNRGSSGFFFAKGETSTGCPYTNVGCVNVSSTNVSKNSLITCPTPIASVTSTLCFSAKANASSNVISCQKSTPVCSLIASTIWMRLKSLSKSTACPSYVIFAVPSTFSAALRIIPSVRFITSLKSVYAVYASNIVNSGLCVVSIPSLRKTRPIS